jgi:hypothetical protein
LVADLCAKFEVRHSDRRLSTELQALPQPNPRTHALIYIIGNLA